MILKYKIKKPYRRGIVVQFDGIPKYKYITYISLMKISLL